MIYVMHNNYPSISGIEITHDEAAELVDLPWPVNPFQLVAVVDTDDLEIAYARTQTTRDDWWKDKLVVAGYPSRSSMVGDLFVQSDGTCWICQDAEFMAVIGRRLVMACIGNTNDVHSYRIKLSNPSRV